MTQTKGKVGIIGAGVAGMSASWDLIRAGYDVTLYEASDRVGGLASGFKDDHWDWTLEKFYHHWFTTDNDILSLIDEIGHREKVIFPRPKTSYWIDGKPVRSEISPSAIFLPLSFISTIRMGLAGVYLKLTSNWQALEKVTAHNWMQKYMGNEAYEKFFKPLLIGKFAEDYNQVPMSWMWARIYKRSLKLGTYHGGFQAFLDDLGKAIQQQGATICLNAPVEKISEPNGKLTLMVNDEAQEFDQVISTTSPKLLLKLTEGLAHTPYGNQVAKLKSIGGLCVVLALKHRLMHDDTYWLNLPASTPGSSQNEFPFLALVEHTNFLPRKHYGGDHIIYCGDYVPADHEYFTMSESELVDRFLPALKTVNPDFNPDWVRKSWVFRAPYAQPVPEINHSQNIPDLKTPINGLYWASMSQVYPWDRGTNYAVELGRQVAKRIID